MKINRVKPIQEELGRGTVYNGKVASSSTRAHERKKENRRPVNLGPEQWHSARTHAAHSRSQSHDRPLGRPGVSQDTPLGSSGVPQGVAALGCCVACVGELAVPSYPTTFLGGGAFAAAFLGGGDFAATFLGGGLAGLGGGM